METLKARLLEGKDASLAAMVMLMAVMSSVTVQAFTAPAAGSFMYDLYDVAINDILNGAPGFVAGVMIMVISAINLTKNWLIAIAGLLGGTILMNADTITTSMGYVI